MRIFSIAITASILFASPAWSQDPTQDPGSLSGTSSAAMLPSPVPTLTETPEPPDVEDDAQALTTTATLSLSTTATSLLAQISENLTVSQDQFLFSIDTNMVVDQPGQNVVAVEVIDLYGELAMRAVRQGDTDARQALLLAEFRGDTRANNAMDQAWTNIPVETIIQNVQAGDPGAKDVLMKLALQGDIQARTYFGMGQPVAVGLPEAMTASAAQALSPAASSEGSTLQPMTLRTSATAGPHPVTPADERLAP